jgi:hypothetical protein
MVMQSSNRISSFLEKIAVNMKGEKKMTAVNRSPLALVQMPSEYLAILKTYIGIGRWTPMLISRPALFEWRDVNGFSGGRST